MTQLQEYTGKFVILSEQGDESFCWDKKDYQQIKDAEEKFDKWKSKGYKIFKVERKKLGKPKQTPMDKFDPDAEEILVIKTLQKG